MPGKGKMETRAFAPAETITAFGQSTHDIYLNNSACYQNMPEKVWDYTVGCYQVIKKWLSYREFELLAALGALDSRQTRRARSRTWPAASPR
jgi:hypothetical protein